MRQRRVPSIIVIALIAACNSSKSSVSLGGASQLVDGVLMPTARTENGITILQHDDSAFSRAPQFTIDTIPSVIFSGGEKGEFDLTYASSPVMLSDGRAIMLSVIGAKVMLFRANGTPERMIGRMGEGPGDFRNPMGLLAVGGDTVLIPDEGNHRVNWVTAANGVVRQTRMNAPKEFFCLRPVGVLPSGTLLSMPSCLTEHNDSVRRPPVNLVLSALNFDSVRAVAEIPGYEMALVATNYGGRTRMSKMPVTMGRRPDAVVWDTLIATTTGETGYTIERRNQAGKLVSEIHVMIPRRPITSKMKDDEINRQIAQLDSHHEEPEFDPKENRRLIREGPFADSLPPYKSMIVGVGGILWVTDAGIPGDTSWGATGFRSDGVIVARVNGHGKGGPIWFGENTVMLREEDADGVVRFAVYGFHPKKS